LFFLLRKNNFCDVGAHNCAQKIKRKEVRNMLKNLTKNKFIMKEVGVHDCAPNETKNNKGRNYAPLQTQSAITLIALIITIIIMIILAGMTISIAVNGRLFQQARQAAEQTEMEKYREELEFELAQKQIEALGQLTLQDLIDAGYVNEQGEIEKEGYIYKIDED
jgi:beta-lactamase regulating signal transducer with metallopeptidase domain